jgi:hypothetical protein
MQMKTCYICGAPTNDDTNECAKHKYVSGEEVQAQAAIRDTGENFAKLDWGKINSFADLRYVMSIIWPHIRVVKGSPEWNALRNFLRD